MPHPQSNSPDASFDLQDPQPADTLPEYAANPLIAALKPIPSTADIIRTLERRPPFAEHERRLPGHIRRHCVLRLVEWFEPLQHHVVHAERMDMMIRTGYRGRNPLESAFAAQLAQRADAIQTGGAIASPFRTSASTARAVALLGASGMGKSATTDNVLNGYQQVIRHSGADGGPTLTQIVWLKVECPSGGSLRTLCLYVLQEMDRLLGTSYVLKANKSNIDTLQLSLAQKLQIHAVGVLVIDEINYLSAARLEKERVINFLTSIVNMTNVPLLLIGTLEGIGVLTDTFRNGRRGSGIGSILFERLERDETWTFFLESMFRYQWTKDQVPLDDELSKTLWNESQGIIDIVVKIFMLSQLRLIAIGETTGRPERLSCELFKNIARTDLALTRPMLDALRSGNPKEIARYGDLRSLQSIFRQRLETIWGSTDSIGNLRSPHHAPIDAGNQPMEATDVSATLSKALSAMGIADDAAAAILARVNQVAPAGDPIAILNSLVETVGGRPPTKVGKRRKPASSTEDPADIRNSLKAAREVGATAHQGLQTAGLVRKPS